MSRRLVSLAVLCAAVCAVALPATAGASFDPEFSVVSQDLNFGQTPTGFAGTTELLNPYNLDQRVGRTHVNCVFTDPHHKGHCKIAVHLDGTIGGYGNLLLKGNLGRGDNTVDVVDGTGDFTGAVTGKAVIHHLNRHTNPIDFHLTR
jgi:hypothetical protein